MVTQIFKFINEVHTLTRQHKNRKLMTHNLISTNGLKKHTYGLADVTQNINMFNIIVEYINKKLQGYPL